MANFIYLPEGGQGQLVARSFADSGLHVRCYPDGAARISVGSPRFQPCRAVHGRKIRDDDRNLKSDGNPARSLLLEGVGEAGFRICVQKGGRGCLNAGGYRDAGRAKRDPDRGGAGQLGARRLGRCVAGHGCGDIGHARAPDPAGPRRDCAAPYDLSFSRYELLRLLAFSRTGALPDHQSIRPAAGACHQRDPRDPPAGGRRAGPAGAAPDGRADQLVQITELGRSTAEDATVTLTSRYSPTSAWMPANRRALVSSIETLRRNAGDF